MQEMTAEVATEIGSSSSDGDLGNAGTTSGSSQQSSASSAASAATVVPAAKDPLKVVTPAPVADDDDDEEQQQPAAKQAEAPATASSSAPVAGEEQPQGDEAQAPAAAPMGEGGRVGGGKEAERESCVPCSPGGTVMMPMGGELAHGWCVVVVIGGGGGADEEAVKAAVRGAVETMLSKAGLQADPAIVQHMNAQMFVPLAYIAQVRASSMKAGRQDG